jgi:putative transcriptional regulator
MGIVDVLDGMDLPWSGDREAMVHFGGPVQPQLGTLLFATESTSSETSTQVLPGLALSQHSGDLAALAAAPPELFRLFLGYAGWGAGQLVEEILRNDWLIAPVDDRFIFSADPSAVWEAALRSVGISPEALPSWTGGGGSAN